MDIKPNSMAESLTTYKPDTTTNFNQIESDICSNPNDNPYSEGPYSSGSDHLENPSLKHKIRMNSNMAEHVCTNTERRNHTHLDHGWAWLVALAASICNVIVFGSLKSAGIILNNVMLEYNASAIEGALIIILNVGITMLLIPLVSHLTSKVHCRWLVSIGGLLISSGLILSAFAKTMTITYVGLGVLCGCGGGLVLPTSYIIINQYFETKRSSAFAIATMGMGIGGLALAPLLAYLFIAYGYSGALLINGALFLNLQVAAALMRPPPAKEQKPSCEDCEALVSESTPLIKSVEVRKPSLSKLLSNGTLMLFLFNNFACTFPSVLTFLPSYALEFHISTGLASVIISVNGLADILGRLTSGKVFDISTPGRKLFYHSSAGIIAGCLVALMSQLYTVTHFFSLTFFHGFMEGIFSAQRTVVPFDFVEVENMSFAIGLIIVAECLGTISGPVMQALIKDFYGSHALGFIIGGALFAFASFLMLINLAVRKLRR